ncbi:MAG: MTH938/NDUFAF3 family protein [Candidatus Omnitrophota bacterium]
MKKMRIDSYTFGSITVNGKRYTSDLIVFPDKIQSYWQRLDSHILNLDDLKEVMEYGPEILVVGRGGSNCMVVPEDTKKTLEEMNVKVLDTNTDDACQIFNDLTSDGKKVVGAFHLTC